MGVLWRILSAPESALHLRQGPFWRK